MATAAASLTGDSSSFSQFRPFVGGVTSSFNKSGTHAHAHAHAHAPNAQVDNMDQSQQRDQPAGAVSARPISLDLNQSNSPSMAELEAVELASTKALIEGVLGPNKDGRVRNPVPSKLKGKTDNKQGNFGVMHMGMSPGKKTEVQGQGRDAAAERDAAARRTSENTASRAKAAQSEKYVPPKKRGLDASLNADTRSRNSPFGGSRDAQRSRPLAPDETKSEQARLLTLLRSINPVTVVDQICKAVAYFGGIPGAPPPEDGIFPESANTRETGALFIGWLAEIFPDLTPKSPEVSKDLAAKRKGRPSKGVKDTPSAESSEAPNSRNGYGYGPAVSAPSWGLPQSLALVNTPVAASTIPLGEPKFHIPEQTLEQPSPTTPAKNQAEDSSSTNKRRRGRPKGSRNKGKDGQPDSETANMTDGQNQGQASPHVQSTTAKVAQPSPAIATTASPMASSFGSTSNTALKTVQNNHVQNNQYSGQRWQASNQLNQTNSAAIVAPTDELSPEERAVLEAFRHHPPGIQQVQQVVPSPIVPPKIAPPETGQKRKRAPAKPKTNPTPTPKYSTENLPQTNHPPILPPGRDNSMGVAKDALQWTSVGPAAAAAAAATTTTTTTTTNASITPTIPPAKRPRQRKPKPPANTETPSRNQTASVVSTATPPIPPSTIPDSQATSSQQSIQQTAPQSNQQSMPQTTSVSRPAAEGLEAHYNYFQQQQQQNGRSNTPTMPQQQVQQHSRQHSKPQSITPQQSTPQMQQQNLMQHQKSQQGQQVTQQTSHRDDSQKMTQSGSARPSSTGFYSQGNQPASATFSQQYPSHQPSQLYGTHQASPQLSNTTSNSYRTSTTHTMAQASPQFSQAENTYRTSSPHTLGHPSPSFSQTGTNYRNPSANTLAQHSPTVTQAENSYRNPSSHSIAQASPSYTTARSHSQSQPSHQSHYNHFSDSSYIDLPTLESLGHSGGVGNTSVGLSNNTYGTTGGFGQGIAVGLGNSRSSATSNSIYGSTSGLSNPYDAGANDILRGVGVSRSGSNSAYGTSGNSGSAYGTSSSRISNSFDPTNQEDMREQLLRGYGRR
ncbi:hypothetical protein ONS95_005002 [Cadophora gregata]|uniref:uncharacterized protein n=1 Tax=Cadophora gregata TaxID=51156 RepID=UPI0026DB449F|nr:uncharacterized protein ONS95_005002 [Cadophora gregata]KAK0104731.1 hypothetical protein ONS95_005002 [Cadophora gregata]KAK0115187.1 hypothetical protein ONS96_013653 [Cadophora gregata f. sp. sojae]